MQPESAIREIPPLALRLQRYLAKKLATVNLDDYNGPPERLEVACDHYLDLATGLRDSEGKAAIWPCPQCGEGSFVAAFEQAVAGCTNEDCEVPSSMQLLELVAYLDPDLEGQDTQDAGQRFSQILEARIRAEQQRQQDRNESRRRAREEKRWQQGTRKQRAKQQGEPEDTLF